MSMDISVYLADQNPQRDRSLGITNVTDLILRGLVAHEGIQLETICSRSSYSLNDDRIRQTVLPFPTDNMITRLLADNIHVFASKAKPDLFFYPKGFLPLLFKSRQPCVGIVHDTILLWSNDNYPEERSRINYRYWIENLKRSVARFDLILTVSEFSRRSILECADRLSINAPDIVVTYNAVPGEFSGMTSDKNDYVVHLASRAPHKKTAWLVEEWIRALDSGRDLPRLILIGSLPDGVQGPVDRQIGIEALSFLPPDQYRRKIAAARALILPSEIEGFGLPALESYLLGTPVCYVAETAVDEILGMPEKTGCFSLSDSATLFSALESVIALPRDEIWKTAKRLGDTYNPVKYTDRIADILRYFV